MMQMIDTEDFMKIIPNECIRTNAIERINKALSKSVVVMFIKGSKKKPFDGYQREALRILNEADVRFTVYDVMRDPDLREILKEISRCSSYPQIFIDKQFIGGLNFLKNAEENNTLTTVIPSTEVKLCLRDQIINLIKKGRIMIFLNGTLDYPTDFDSEEIALIFREKKY